MVHCLLILQSRVNATSPQTVFHGQNVTFNSPTAADCVCVSLWFNRDAHS